MEEDFRAFLLADGTIAGLVVDRVQWAEVPAGRTRPLISLWTFANSPDYVMEGPSGLESRRLSIDCWGMTFAEAKSVSRAVRARLAAAPATQGGTLFQGLFIVAAREFNQPQGGAPAQRYFRDSLDVMAWYNATA